MSNKFDKTSSIKGLILNRKAGQKVLVNKGEIEIEVVEIKGGQVRLAFKAHKEIIIQRSELLEDSDHSSEFETP